MKPETRLQIDLVEWLNQAYPEALFTSTQAGDRRSKLAAMMMKRMGYRNGTPDLIFFEPCQGFHGLVVELKTEVGTWSISQREFRDQAIRRGYKYVVAYGYSLAKQEIINYMSGNRYTKNPYETGKGR